MRTKIPKQDKKLLDKIKSNIDNWYSYYSHNVETYRQDTEFSYLENGQWDKAEINDYKDNGRPRFTFNMIPKYLNSMAAQFEQNIPQPKVRSSTDGEIYDLSHQDSQETVDIVTSLLRRIALRSETNLVYSTAASCAWTGGYGAFRIVVEPESDLSFNYCIRYKSVENPTLCYWDSSAREVDKSDGDYCGVVTQISKAEFKEKYPKFKVAEADDFEVTDQPFPWQDKESIAICDYYMKEYYTVNVVLLSNGSFIKKPEEEVEQELSKYNAINPEPLSIVKSEMKTTYRIKHYRITQNYIIEESIFPGEQLPIIFQAGITKWIKGREYTYSAIRFMKDAQKSYNRSRSELVYRLQTSRIAPWLVATGNIPSGKGKNDQWTNAHRQQGALVFNEVQSGFIPQRQQPQQIDPVLIQEVERSYFDIQNIPGRSEVATGAPSNESSGVAVNNRLASSNLNIKIFFDNALKAIESGLRCSIGALPEVYDGRRTVSISTHDGKTLSQPINDERKKETMIKATKYTVEVKAGASFEMDKQQQFNNMVNAIRVNPELGKISPDILAELVDIKSADTLVQRAKDLIPVIIAKEEKKPAPQQKPNPLMMAQVQNINADTQKKQTEAMKNQSEAAKTQMETHSSHIGAATDIMKELGKKEIEDSKIDLGHRKVDAEMAKANTDLAREYISVAGRGEA